MIEIINLYKYYDERRAVGPLSVRIDKGEIVGLLGLNGAGKTTTLRILACDLLPSSGTVRVDGIDVVESPHEVRARIGYLPDTPPLYTEMAVGDYLTFAAKLRGLSASEAARRVPEVLALCQLENVAFQGISTLSHGFKQRVGIAQAIVHKPQLLVLDEPISGLDPVQIVEMRELLRTLKGEHTIVLSSHILSEISETCDRILVIRDGQIGASGTEQELSASLRSGVRIEVTVRGEGYRAREVLMGVEGVREVSDAPPTETGAGIASFHIDSDRDVREAVCAALVAERVGLLEIRRSEHELESVFLKLAGPGGQAPEQASANGRQQGPNAKEQVV